ncbi:molybdenum cofactor biosynthesis protein [Paenibacillus marinisediminis]
MKYSVHCFAGLADLTGQAIVILDSNQASMSVADIKKLLSELYPNAAHALSRAFMAVNQEYATDDRIVQPTDELALIPPVSGGEGHIEDSSTAEPSIQTEHGRYVLTYAPIHVDELSAYVAHPDHGAALTFVGTTREHTGGLRTIRLDYEAYAPMAIKQLAAIGQDIGTRWPGTSSAITHRLGTVPIGEASVVIAVSSPHRAECYEASRYAIEKLKQVVPIWKKEVGEDSAAWVEPHQGAWNPLSPIN